MIPVEQAQATILDAATPLPAERLPLTDALDRVAAASVVAPFPVPPWDNSAMDGYAVRASDTGPGVRLPLSGVVGAGAVGEPLAPGHAVAIMTGAPVPDGADAVIIVENTDGATQGEVELADGVEAGANIRRMGSDVARGSVVVEPGQTLTPGLLGMLASVGCTDVAVARQPRVALLCTGDEIIRPGRPLGPGQIYSSNPVALTAALRRSGAQPWDLGDVEDDLDATVLAMERGLEADALVTTGGVSVGRFDLVKQAFEVLGVPILFWKVRMKPGKPLAFGVVERRGRRVPVFGLPGNPVSCQVNHWMFVHPWIRAVQGDPNPLLPVIDAVALEAMPEKPGRAKLLRVVLEHTERGWGARRTGTQSSGAGSSMARAHGLLWLDAEQGGVARGEPVRVIVVETSFL